MNEAIVAIRETAADYWTCLPVEKKGMLILLGSIALAFTAVLSAIV